MNAAMRITIMVVRRDAQALQGVTQQLKSLTAQAAKASAALAGIGRGGGMGGIVSGFNSGSGAASRFLGSIGQIPHRMIQLGKDIQWTGRQLEYRFSLPLIAAGVAVARWALQNETAATKLRKVYGDLSMSMEDVKAQTDAMRGGWRALSDIFGVAQDEVIGIAATWAQAGSQGTALMQRTRATIEAMIVTELDAQKATQGLIVLTQAYELSAKELSDALALINVVENQTSASTQDIIEVFEKAGGVAHTAGISVQELAAMTASLVPVAGSAAEAGTFLKTAIQAVMAPTDQARAVMEQMGFATMSAAWNSKTFTQRLEDMSKAWVDLTQPQKLQAARDLFGLRQASRGIILLDDWANAQGRAKSAIEATSDAMANQKKMQQEIEIFLSSSPQGFQIAMQQIKNALVEVIIPMLPSLVLLAKNIAGVFRAFNELSPATRNFIITMAALLAIAGPIIAYLGAFITLFGTLFKVVLSVGRAFLFLAPAMARGVAALVTMNPLLALALAALALLAFAVWKYPDEVRRAMKAIVQAFISGFQALITLVTGGAKAVYKALSYINPFARHSPSLVEQVDKGIDFIVNKYKSLNGLGGAIHGAAAAYRDFLSATAAARAGFEAADFNAIRDAVAQVFPEAIAALDELNAKLGILRAQLGALEAEIAAQRGVVKQWEDTIDGLSDAIDAANEELDRLRDIADGLADELNAAKDHLSELARTPIAGMGAMEDAIFANEMAVKQLQLAIMDLEDASNPVADLSDEFARLNGELEGLSSKEKSLRMAGAGSDVLGPITSQIAALEGKRNLLSSGGTGGGANAELEAMKKQLEQLQRQGERLNLEKSLQFDPLTRQIDRLVNGMEEMPFDAIVAGIQGEKAHIAELTAAWEGANEAVKAQEQVVKGLEAERKAAQKQLDIEQEKLQELENQYDDIKDAIDEMADAMKDFGDRAKQAIEDAKAGDLGSLDIPGDFEPSIGGGTIQDPSSTLKEIQDLVDQWLAEANAGAGDPFGWIRTKWEELKAWWGGSALSQWGDKLMEFGQKTADFLQGVDWSGMWDSFKTNMGNAMDWVGQKFSDVWNGILDFLGPIGEEMRNWGDELSDIWTIISTTFGIMWNILEPGLGLIWETIKITFDTIRDFLKEHWDSIEKIFSNSLGLIWDTVKNVWEGIKLTTGGALEVIRGIFKTIAGLIQGDWDKVWDGIKLVVDGAWKVIKGTIGTALNEVWDIIKRSMDSIGAVWDLGWGALESTFKHVFRTIFAAVRGGVNTIISIVNTLIRGINGMLDLVPGVGGKTIPTIGEWSGDLPFFAKGGALPSSAVGNGFITNGARAIVGEGNPNHPEYVIPTDPAYRDRAMRLLFGLAKELGLKSGGVIPRFGIGGIIDTIGEGIDTITGKAREVAVTTALAPVLAAFDLAMRAVPDTGIMGIMKAMVMKAKNDVYNDLKGTPRGANGFLINPTVGGTLIRAGEAGRREALVPLPAHMSADALGGGGTINIYGNLEFPNITDPNDAEEFIKNLRSLGAH